MYNIYINIYVEALLYFCNIFIHSSIIIYLNESFKYVNESFKYNCIHI